jgi:hypothetical protein
VERQQFNVMLPVELVERLRKLCGGRKAAGFIVQKALEAYLLKDKEEKK